MRELLNITKALSDPGRVRALMALRTGELCVCQIIELLGLSPATVSKHMSLLHQAGLVRTRKDGRWNYYRLADQPSREVQAAMAMLTDSLSDDPAIAQDARAVKKLRKMKLQDLCRHYRTCCQ